MTVVSFVLAAAVIHTQYRIFLNSRPRRTPKGLPTRKTGES